MLSIVCFGLQIYVSFFRIPLFLAPRGDRSEWERDLCNYLSLHRRDRSEKKFELSVNIV